MLAPPSAISGHAGAIVGNKVFVCGGMGRVNEGHFFREAWLVDPVNGAWETLPEPEVARGMAAAAELGGSVYLAGGFLWSGETLSSAERFDLRTRRWSRVAPLLKPRSRLALVALGGTLYAVAGMRGVAHANEPINTPSIEAYDAGHDSWHEVGRLNHARHGFACTGWRGRIYVFGGNDYETRRSVEVWDPRTKVATDLPEMPIPRGFASAVCVEDRIILFGGRSSTGHPSAFDAAAGTWSEIRGPDIDINRCSTIVLGRRLWTIGGETPRPVQVIRSFDLGLWRSS